MLPLYATPLRHYFDALLRYDADADAR